jgi:polynucleotide 5'-kinase involved in rRNA processing
MRTGTRPAHRGGSPRPCIADAHAAQARVTTTPDKLMRLWRHDHRQAHRPVRLAIAGDSAAGKTTLTRGIAEALGPDRATAPCVDDYHR